MCDLFEGNNYCCPLSLWKNRNKFSKVLSNLDFTIFILLHFYMGIGKIRAEFVYNVTVMVVSRLINKVYQKFTAEILQKSLSIIIMK